MKGRVYKRGKSWYYRFDIEPDPLTGKRRQVNGSGYRTEREAWKVCRAAMADHEKGRAVSSSRRKVADALAGLGPAEPARLSQIWRGLVRRLFLLAG
jgi:Arm DNA-binding domain